MPRNTPRNDKNTPLSAALAEKGTAAILEPTPLPFEWQGKTYAILPMPDALLMRIADESATVVGILDAIGNARLDRLSAREIAPLLPQIVRFLLPNATRIISVCLGIDEQIVADTMRLVKKVEALTLIVQAEDFPLLLKNCGALTATFGLSELTETMTETTKETMGTATDLG